MVGLGNQRGCTGDGGADAGADKDSGCKKSGKGGGDLVLDVAVGHFEFPSGLNWCFANHLAKMSVTLHRPCQFMEIHIYQLVRQILASGQYERKLNNGEKCQYLA